MNKPHSLLFSALLTSILTASSPLYGRFFDWDAWDEEIEQQLEQMHQSMRHMRKQCKQMSAQTLVTAPASPHISLHTTDKGVTITIGNIEIDNVEARLNDANNQLTITTPSKKFVIATRDTMVAVEAQEIVQQQSKDDAKQSVMHFSGASVYRTQSIVGGNPALEKQSTEYIADKKELVITIPFHQVSKGKVVPINRVSSQETQNTASSDTKSEKQELPAQK